jgi:hypothetical protein
MIRPGDPVDWADITAGVPAAIAAAAGWPAERRVKEADRCADVIASGAAVLRAGAVGTGRAEITPGQVREAIVTGLGILACRPGGVGFMGAHWHAVRLRCAACPGPGTVPLFGLPDPGEAIGAVFTPRALADEVAAHALAVVSQPVSMCPAADIEGLRVADPFCGSGAFLAAAARYLGDALAAAWDGRDAAEVASLCALYGTSDPVMAARAVVIAHCLYGVDLDPVSVELAGLALQLLAPECGTDHILDVDDGNYERYVASPDGGERAGQHALLRRPPGPPSARLPGLRAGDSLTGWPRAPLPARLAGQAGVDWPGAFPGVFDDRGGFDAVIGNPPFLGGNKIAAACGHAYREHLITAIADGRRTTADLAVYCWLRMHQLTRRDGVVGVIGPDNMLKGGNAKLAISLLEQDGWRPYRHARGLRWPTRTAAVSVCTIWTYQWGGASPPEELRNFPQIAPPAHLWRLARTISADGSPIDVYVPVLPREPAAPRRYAARPGGLRRGGGPA